MMARFDVASSRFGFSTRIRDGVHALRLAAELDDAVGGDAVPGDALDGHDRALDAIEDVHHLLQPSRLRIQHVVGQKDGEGLVADQVARDENGVAQPQRLALADRRHGGELRNPADLIEKRRLAARVEERLEFG